jgi:hypothetical protein
MRKVAVAVLMASAGAYAQQNPGAPASFIKVTAPVVAITHARVVDGTGRRSARTRP